MRRIMLLTTLTAIVAASIAFSGVAQAATPESKCRDLAVLTLGTSFDPANYTFIGGTTGTDVFDVQGTDGTDVFCGFGGDDRMGDTLLPGDIFLGGGGNDSIAAEFGEFCNCGTFYGGAGFDSVGYNGSSGIFNSGLDNDSVNEVNFGTFNGGAGDDRARRNGDLGATFNGGAGDDSVGVNYSTFNGGLDNDSVEYNSGTVNGGGGDDGINENRGTFLGGGGNDSVNQNYGPFNGGGGYDIVFEYYSGSLLYVEQVN
jgi:hypothetical protein